MTWRGPALDEEQRDIFSLMNDLLSGEQPLVDENTETVDQAKGKLVELGLWTLGVDEEHGGSGAPRETVLLVLERLGRLWPALGWASVQAQAALAAIGGDARFSDLADEINAGSLGVAVVDEASAHVRLTTEGGGLKGSIGRVDTASGLPAVVVLGPAGTAHVLRPETLEGAPVERTGLGGARTVSLSVDAKSADIIEVDSQEIRGLLRLGAAAVAAGIAGAAADAAVEYASSRDQFGGPLTGIPVVRQSLQEQAAGATTALTATFGADPYDPVQTAATLAKACDTAIDVAGRALQSHGGYGYLTEYPAERFVRDAVSLRAAADPAGSMLLASRALVGKLPA
ncbi:acyl-CoA dehydrogenase family protein [Arthrobacter sp. NPDC080031]|uniref:acyl-CoA dehydrogenase family protein n=1 Tax=Arthrobacter sp. NPDC080031 TaxID=3155918 RepID=UPI00344B809E